jgi:hypothetical protein
MMLLQMRNKLQMGSKSRDTVELVGYCHAFFLMDMDSIAMQ